MREIKFRAYDLVDQQTRYDITDLEYCGNEITGIFIDGDFYNRKEIELMQYTGLKDKNGVEIYEGDIVYCQTKFGKAKAIIEFRNGKFVAYWDSVITHPKNGHHIACYDINKKNEVIGNIYENEKLLEGQI